MRRLRVLLDALRTNFFVLPAAAVVAGAVLGRWMVALGWDVGIGPTTVDSSRAALAAAAAATITFASIALSVSLLIMQQGSAQFSARVVASLSRDPFNRRVIALVLGTFTYCLVVLERVRGPVDGNDAIVPVGATALGVVGAIAAVLAVVGMLQHTARQMDVSEILDRITAQTVSAPAPGETGELTPCGDEARPPPEASGSRIRFERGGWIRSIDRPAILGAVDGAHVVRLDTETGRYAIAGTPLATVWPALDRAEADRVARAMRAAVHLGPSRTMSEDRGYGVRQLVDVALRALSPGVNDPTTASDAIFHLGAVLVDHLCAPPVPTAYEDQRGCRLLAPHALNDTDLADLAVSELRVYGASNPAVVVDLLEMLATVVEAVSATGAGPRTAPLVEQARLVLADAEASGLAEHDRRRVRQAYEDRFGS